MVSKPSAAALSKVSKPNVDCNHVNNYYRHKPWFCFALAFMRRLATLPFCGRPPWPARRVMVMWVNLERRKMLTNLVCLKRRNVHCLVSRFTTRYTLTKLQFTVFVNPFKRTCQLFVSDTRPERPLVAHFFLPRGRNRQRKSSLGGQPVSTHFKVNT